MKNINIQSNISPIHISFFSDLSLLEKIPSGGYFFSDLSLLEKISPEEKKKFHNILLPNDHFIKVYKLINEYLAQEIHWSFEYLKHEYNIASLSSLLISCKEDDILSAFRDKEIIENVIASISIYKYFIDNILLGNIIFFKKTNIQDSFFTDENDYKYSKLIHSEIVKLAGKSQILISVFYLLLFFNLFSIFSRSVDNEFYSNELKGIARFVLNVLPLLVGTYRYGNFSSLLRDYAFKILDLKRYNEIKNLINKGFPSNTFISNAEIYLKEISINFPSNFDVHGRKKGIYSAFIKSQQYKIPVEKLWDLYAIRIIIESDNEGYCYEMLTYLEKKWRRWENKKGYCDYIANSKENGYRSIHIVITNEEKELIEVQIRTRLMHLVAELGLASHEAYKNKTNKNKQVDAEYDPLIIKGKLIIEKYLSNNGLSLNDYIDYLKTALKILPIEHYYEGIAKKKYNPSQIVNSIISSRKKK